MRKPLRSVSAEPSAFWVGAIQDSVAEPVVAGTVTVTVNAARDARVVPSLTLMAMLLYVPALAAVGVPESCPVAILKLAQAGLLVTLKVSVAPLWPAACGVKLYTDPATAVVIGVPVIVGGVVAVDDDVVEVVDVEEVDVDVVDGAVGGADIEEGTVVVVDVVAADLGGVDVVVVDVVDGAVGGADIEDGAVVVVDVVAADLGTVDVVVVAYALTAPAPALAVLVAS
jgi:hypothetical protein